MRRKLIERMVIACCLFAGFLYFMSGNRVNDSILCKPLAITKFVRGRDGELECIFKERRRQLASACKKHAINKEPPSLDNNFALRSWVTSRYDKHIFVDHVHRIIFCDQPRSASTAWRRYFIAQLTNENSNLSKIINQERVHSDILTLKPLPSYSLGEMLHLIRTYTKITFVRNPLDRLYSAWASKLAVKSWYNKRWGTTRIISVYRLNATADELGAGYPVYLEEFFRYLLEHPDDDDDHWTSEQTNCNLCSLPYDYIGHFENLLEETDYLIRNVIKPQRPWIKFPSNDSASMLNQSTAIFLKSIRRLPRDLLLKVAEMKTRRDFELLGYNYAETLNDYEKKLDTY